MVAAVVTVHRENLHHAQAYNVARGRLAAQTPDDMKRAFTVTRALGHDVTNIR